VSDEQADQTTGTVEETGVSAFDGAPQTEAPTAAEEEPRTAEEAPQYGVGPFSIREVVLGGIWLVAFVVSFFPFIGGMGVGPSVWENGIDWVLTIGVPTAAVFLLGLRRLSPDGIRRVGSLGIDQFASVAFSVSTIVWLGILWNSFITLASNRIFLATWVVWVELFLMLAGTLLTVFGPFIAPFDQDFVGRGETAAHRNASPIRAISARPAPVFVPAPAPAPEPAAEEAPAEEPAVAAEEPAAPEPAAEEAAEQEEPEALTPEPARDTFEPVGEEQPVRHQAFWALAPEDREVVDEVGIPLFRIGPTAWALVIEDRGETFVVRHEDGRIGYLHDVSDVTRG